MGAEQLVGLDLREGIAESRLRDAPLLGHVDGKPALLIRDGQRIRAVGAHCTHHGASLAAGIIIDGEIRCPQHHACFDLASGRARGPALTPLPCWHVIVEDGRIRVGAPRPRMVSDVTGPRCVVIIGAGAAGVACAQTLRGDGFRGSVTIVSAEGSDPVDRPHLSKHVLAGRATDERAFLRTADALRAQDISIVEGAATRIDVERRIVDAGDRQLEWDALLIATGSEPRRLDIPGADLPHVYTLRTLADSRAIAAAARDKAPVVIAGASFIGLETAAALRARGAEVTVVAPEAAPLLHVFGEQAGAFLHRIHTANGITFRLGRRPAWIGNDHVELDDGTRLPASLVVLGVGVTPRTALAAAAGLAVDDGIIVDGDLRAAPGIWAAGDVARYPWAGRLVRIEHWQVAVRHGQRVARAMLDQPRRPHVPFFWSQHHDVRIAYVGHASPHAAIEVRGSLYARRAHLVYRRGGTVEAVATIGRDRLALRVAEAMERNAHAEIERLVRDGDAA